MDDAGTPTGAFSDVVTRAVYDQFFLHRDDSACEGGLFTYDALVEAAATFPEFCNEGSLDVRRREAAAFLANISHETTGGWATAPDGPHAWGLCFKEEIGCGGGGCTGYCSASAMWPCASGQTYHGRGPMQLSWNYNYGPAGAALGLDLLNNPQPRHQQRDRRVSHRDLVLDDQPATQTIRPRRHGRQLDSFGLGHRRESQARVWHDRQHHQRRPRMQSQRGRTRRRSEIGFFTRYADLLGVDTGDNVDCADMTSY